ncbi:MAG: UDP-N-acetylglucosamine 1-carboxyvinyltransferase [Acutalibacteraceae bacterium]|nr:UDP-N-acetylglucosamine 1-carboxyvinyltransferase [Clostridia bacterium]MEE1126724.1 UDP-N-acetylglucosamine 1-carboxyvinyltransferase [Acutalibacteraceae bacterium]MBQ2000538.1 UDP-N-acetylglucosamine 1-carboxyvinyltransferase [Clostridia bacterium]MBQ2319430.1 UDP-N-acetylglucosamine 1-carboxyvinyltransferase [Clostridia bacterium]MBQ2388016.1 UDP-N-acetylglucosamine 1-carboxyvinyltransferase [Clostridia bacterium]
MDKLVINGKKRLNGEITISGAKNAAVAIIPAAILSDGICRIENLPDISDVNELITILGELGAGVRRIDDATIEIDSSTISSYVVPAEKSKRLRASSYLMGAMLGRFSKASVAPPGGCDFGTRPIDQHIKGFELLGSTVDIENGMVNIIADKLMGNQVYLDVVSVGATVNIMLAAVKAKGLTVIENAAKEPHIVDLANFLLSMGADIRGAGTDTIKIRGVSHLHGTTYSIIPDQIEAGTYMAAVVAASGDVIIKNVIPKHLESITAKLIEMGATIDDLDDALRVRSNGKIRRCNIKTMPHPGFPTDMQPQIATVLSVADGKSVITESIWDNRFRYAEQLEKLGAYIEAEGKVATIYGVEGLRGNTVKATDLRAGAAMVIAGLIAEGQTVIEDIHHIQRGYEKIVEKLSSVGADIQIISD